MKILINNGIWHKDCPENKWNSGVIKELERGEDKTLVECLHCGQKGYIHKGAPFRAEVTIEDA